MTDHQTLHALSEIGHHYRRSGSDEPPHSLDFLRTGNRTLDPHQVDLVLTHCNYEHERKIDKDHIRMLADTMARGKWGTRSTLDFAVLAGRLILVNGYHRLKAQRIVGGTIEYNIVHHPVHSIEELRELYHRFDTLLRKRSSADVLNGMQYAETHGLSRKTAVALFNAIPMIASNFPDQIHGLDRMVTKVIDRRLSAAEPYLAAARQMEFCLQKSHHHIRARLTGVGCMSVALVILRYQPELGTTFWSGVAKNDGLRRGDPRHTLLSDLETRQRKGYALAPVCGPPAVAWNAFYTGRTLSIVKLPPNYQVTIAGTPFAKRNVEPDPTETEIQS